MTIVYEPITPKSPRAALLKAYLYRRPSGESALYIPAKGEETGHGEGNCGIVALDGERLIGAAIGTRRFGAYYGRCTYVRPTYRGKGIATALWAELLKKWPVGKVYLVTFSDLGLTMVESLKRQWPDIKWHVKEDGDRRLRRLRREA